MDEKGVCVVEVGKDPNPRLPWRALINSDQNGRQLEKHSYIL